MSGKKQIELGNITPANFQQLKTINVSTLPVRYTDKFYSDLVLNCPSDLLQFAYWNGFVIAAVCARIESHDTIEGKKRLYIMTINVLSAYRRRGIAARLLNHVLGAVANDPDILEVYLNVQTSNEDARQFYLKNGFIQTDMIPNYYKRIDPPDSFVLKKSLREGHEVKSSVTASAVDGCTASADGGSSNGCDSNNNSSSNNNHSEEA